MACIGGGAEYKYYTTDESIFNALNLLKRLYLNDSVNELDDYLMNDQYVEYTISKCEPFSIGISFTFHEANLSDLSILCGHELYKIYSAASALPKVSVVAAQVAGASVQGRVATADKHSEG